MKINKWIIFGLVLFGIIFWQHGDIFTPGNSKDQAGNLIGVFLFCTIAALIVVALFLEYSKEKKEDEHWNNKQKQHKDLYKRFTEDLKQKDQNQSRSQRNLTKTDFLFVKEIKSMYF